MNAQRLIDSLRVCMMVLHPVSGRCFPGRMGVLLTLILVAMACSVSAYADEYDIIIEKNLFHDQRQKWEMEKSPIKGSSSQSGPRENQNIDQINLFGTVVKDSHSYAVMRVTQAPAQRAAQRRAARRGSQGAGDARRGVPGGEKSQENKRPYAVGDFISGYQVFEIKPESVLLQDPYDNKRYEIFMNASAIERTAVRTEIPEDTPETPPPSEDKAPQQPRSSKERSAAPQDPAAAADFLRQRFEKDLEAMRDKRNNAAQQQAERDAEELESMPPLDEKGQEELMRLKSQFEKLRQ